VRTTATKPPNAANTRGVAGELWCMTKLTSGG
jgi:hypothetical protein